MTYHYRIAALSYYRIKNPKPRRKSKKDFVQMYLKHRDKIIAHNIVYGDNSNYYSVESSANACTSPN